ncbi:MAG: hypothetical protein ACXWUW_08000, partial [Rhodoplanes sp.]
RLPSIGPQLGKYMNRTAVGLTRQSMRRFSVCGRQHGPPGLRRAVTTRGGDHDHYLFMRELDPRMHAALQHMRRVSMDRRVFARR